MTAKQESTESDAKNPHESKLSCKCPLEAECSSPVSGSGLRYPDDNVQMVLSSKSKVLSNWQPKLSFRPIR